MRALQAVRATELRDWLARHDRDYAALRRAGRTAIVMPALFAFGAKVVGNADARDVRGVRLVRDAAVRRLRRPDPRTAAGPGGARRRRLRCSSRWARWRRANVVVSAVAMAVVGFAILFAGVVSSVLAASTTSLLLAFILPVSLPAGASPRSPTGSRAGPSPRWCRWSPSACCGRHPYATRCAARRLAACAALAARLRAEIACRLSNGDALLRTAYDERSRPGRPRGACCAAPRVLRPRPTGRPA